MRGRLGDPHGVSGGRDFAVYLLVDSGRGDDGIHHGIAGGDDGLHRDGDGQQFDALHRQRFGHGYGQCQSDGECEFGDDLRGRLGDPHGVSGGRDFAIYLLVESGRGDDGIHHGVAVGDDGLHGDGDGQQFDALRWQRFGHGDGQSAADGECEFADDLRGRLGDADGDDRREQSELPVE